MWEKSHWCCSACLTWYAHWLSPVREPRLQWPPYYYREPLGVSALLCFDWAVMNTQVVPNEKMMRWLWWLNVRLRLVISIKYSCQYHEPVLIMFGHSRYIISVPGCGPVQVLLALTGSNCWSRLGNSHRLRWSQYKVHSAGFNSQFENNLKWDFLSLRNIWCLGAKWPNQCQNISMFFPDFSL